MAPVVLVTGCSSGIGRACVERFAAEGWRVVATARRPESIADLASASVTTLRLDVDDSASIARGVSEAVERVGPIDVLVNNAGFGVYRAFVDIEPARDAELIQLNVAALVELSHAFAAAHRGRARDAAPAYLMNVASVVAWQAIPHFATYAASKAFVRSFSEALHYELAPHGIVVTCLCPGGTHSEFHAIAGAGPKQGLAAAAMLSSAEVAERGVAAMLRGKKTLVTGALNKLSCFFTGLAPRGLASRASARVLGPPPAPAETERPPARGEP